MGFHNAHRVSVAVLGLFLTACAQSETVTLAAAPDNLFDKSLPIKVTSVNRITERHGVIAEGSLEGARQGMWKGGSSLSGMGPGGDPLGAAVGIIALSVAVVGGGIYGALAASSTEDTNAAIASIERVYKDVRARKTLKNLIVTRLSEAGFQEAASCPGIAVTPEPVQSTRDPAAKERVCDNDNPSYRLRLEVHYAFRTSGTISPDLSFVVDASAVTAGATGNEEKQGFRWLYYSSKVDFFDATEADAVGLRKKIANAERKLADKILRDLIVSPQSTSLEGWKAVEYGEMRFSPRFISSDTAVRVPENTIIEPAR